MAGLQRVGNLGRKLCAWKPVLSSLKMNMNVVGLHSTTVLNDDFTNEIKFETEKLHQERKALDEEEKIKYDILNAALEEVLVHGWSKDAIEAGLSKANRPSVMAGVVDGVEELVLHHIKISNERLNEWMDMEISRVTSSGSKLSISRFIRSCIIKRLSYNIPFISAGLWPEGMALVANPKWAAKALQCKQELCDDIWFKAGDKSTDMNWYSKRVTLGVIIAATEIFMIQDASEGFKDTWEFLDRRLEDLSSLPSVTKIPGDVAGLLDGGFQTAKILVGIQK